MDNLDFPEGVPVTKAESVNLNIGSKQQTIADVYLNPASDHNVNVNGPFEQTLFLGCSIVNFNVNLGWGGENSTLTVTLVEDDAYHWNDPLSQYNTQIMRNTLTTPASFDGYATNPGVGDTRPGLNTIQGNTNQSLNRDEFPGKVGPTGYDLSSFGPTMFPNIPTSQDTRRDWFRAIYDKEIRLDAERKAEQAVLKDPRLARGDFGKVYYKLGLDGAWIKQYWTKPDPGFVGHAYDILGTAVRFIFHGFEFAGLVSSWKKNAGQGGYNQYTVEIKSFSTLLSNTQLVIDHYAGSIFTRLPESDSTQPVVFDQIGGLGLPSNDIGDTKGRYGGEDWLASIAGESSKVNNYDKKYVGTISQGNLTNVFNIYGYMEAVVGFGKHDVNELGTKIKHIYAGIQDLISYTPEYNEEEGFKIGLMDTRFSPYGRIIGKSPALTKLPELSPNIESGVFNVIYLRDTYQIVEPSQAPVLTVKEKSFNSPVPPYYYQTLYSPGEIHQIPYTLRDAGCIPTKQSVDGIYRQHYTIDLSELPPIPDDARIKGPVISITDLVDNVCSQANYDWFVDFDYPNNKIKIRTISRQNQPANNYIEHLLLSAAGSANITAYDYGKEFNDSATVRSMYIGAKQKRLLQVNSNFLSNKTNSLVFDPYDDEGRGSLLFHQIGDITNSVRIPDHFSTRNLQHPYYNDQIFMAGVENYSSGTGAVIWEPFYRQSWNGWDGNRCGLGNYLDPITYKGPNYDYVDKKGDALDIFTDLGNLMYNRYSYLPYDQKNNSVTTVTTDSTFQFRPDSHGYMNYPLWDEFICPYFGLDADGNARKVFYDQAMRQMQVLCSIGDLQNILGFRLTSAIDIGSGNVTTTAWSNPDATSGTPPDPTNPLPPSGGGISYGQAVGSNIPLGTFRKRNMSWNLSKREFYDYDAKFLVTENEIRSAIASFDSWMTYTFNKDFTTDLGQILRKTIFAQSGSLVQQSSSELDEKARINMGRDYPVSIVFNGSNVGITTGSSSETPNTSESDVLKDKIKSTLEGAFNYVKELGSYYGKQYMVKVPGVSISRTKTTPTGTKMSVSLLSQTHAVDEYETGGEYYTSYKPATDGAWEEIGNIIDDTIVIGSTNGDFFREADGRYGPILGFKGSYEYLSDTIDESLLSMTFGVEDPLNEINTLVGGFEGYLNYRSAPSGISTAGMTPKEIRSAYLGEEGSFGSSKTSTPRASVPTTAMLFATASQPATGTDIIPNDWYSSITSSLNDSESLYYQYYNNFTSPISIDMPSFAKDREIRTSSHGKLVPYNLRFKFYAKASIEENFVFINALGAYKSSALYNRAEGKELRAILTLGSEVVANPVHLVDKFVGHALQLDSALFKKEGCTTPADIAGNTLVNVYKKVQAPLEPKQIKQKLLEKVNSTTNIETQSILVVDGSYSSYYGTVNGGLLPFSGGYGAGNGLDILKTVTDHLLKSVNASFSSEENKALTMPIAPKAVMPGFAAVPLESQTAVYGPWTNQPYLLRKEIFGDEDLKTQPLALMNSIENLVGGLKVEVAEDLAPWRYGGMTALDAAVITKIQNDAAYQLQIEQGTMDIPGAPFYKLGDFLHRAAGAAGGPIINNISANIDSGGITTKYSFRTFSKKFSMYNKENADRLAKINTESIKRRKDIALRSAKITNNAARNSKRRNLNNYSNVDYVNPPMAASWRSASELLIGHNEISIRLPNTRSEDSLENVSLVSGVLSNFDYDLGWGFRPKVNADQHKANMYNVVDYPKIFSHSKILDSREASRILSSDYENQACMSLDGLLSPISFYPTENFSTYHITKYDRDKCRYCLGLGLIQYPDAATKMSQGIYPIQEDKQEDNSTGDEEKPPYSDNPAIFDISYNKTKPLAKVISCPFCEPVSNKISGIITSTKGGKADPPYVVTTGVDSISSDGYFVKDNKIILETRGTIINHTTLNPIVMSHGEFSVFQNRQSGDFTGHSIKMVGMGSIPPAGPNDSLSQATCGENRLLKSFLEYDQLYIDKVKELYDIPAEKRTKTIESIIAAIGTNSPTPFANNSRFFGFRGPMMLHGWGYDTEGYPVPNASGDYAYTKDPTDEELPGFGKKPIKVKVKDTGQEKYIFQNQRFVKKDDIDPDVVDKLDVEWVELESVDLPGTDETYSGEGYFTEPYKENSFAKGWAQVPSTWPVGPIDLRWDEKAKVWTVPSTYRNVYVLLEEDLRSNIARGEIIDNSTKTDTSVFGAGYRKMVLVRDTYGVYAAPRSSLIYCAYDTESGYYEPISQSSFTTSGVIIGANSANMYKVFKKKIKNVANNTIQNNDEDNQFIATFTNPLDIAIDAGDTALFTYLPDGWIVQSSRG